jgi:hypothetical protein
MLYTLSSDGGMYSIFEGTDSIHDEIVIYNYNNFLWVNPYSPIFHKNNIEINLILGTYLNLDSCSLLKIIDNFQYDKDIIKNYKKNNLLITSILDKYGVNFEDFFWANQIRENDIPENKYSVSFIEPENDPVGFFENHDVYFPANHSKNKNILKEYIKLCEKSNTLIMAKNIKLVNLKKGCSFLIFFSHSMNEASRLAEKDSQHYINSPILKTTTKSNIKIVHYDLKKKNLNMSSNDIEELEIPSLLVDIKEDSEYEEICLMTYKIAKYIVIKKLINEENNYVIDETLDFQDSWNYRNTLPKIFFFGSYFSIAPSNDL